MTTADEQALHSILDRAGLVFVNRSYGAYTSNPVSRETLMALMREAREVSVPGSVVQDCTSPGSSPRCGICGRLLNQSDDPTTHDCGGDCLRCMADAGDPDCEVAMKSITIKRVVSLLAGESPVADDVRSCLIGSIGVFAGLHGDAALEAACGLELGMRKPADPQH
jgi:hypothetical protein